VVSDERTVAIGICPHCRKVIAILNDGTTYECESGESAEEIIQTFTNDANAIGLMVEFVKVISCLHN
jgi:hypothetical protein